MSTEHQDIRECGHPGGGQGRKDEVGRSGVQPVSIAHVPRPDAVIRGMAEWGQGERGAAGYQDHGESELRLVPPRDEVIPSQHTAPRQRPKRTPKPAETFQPSEQPAGALPCGLIRDRRQPWPVQS
jgi:hypothetical protein